MEQIAAIMLLVGCSPNNTACHEIPVPTPIYQSVEACKAELPLAIRMSGASGSQVLGSCSGVDSAMLEQSATIDWAVSRGGELQVAVKAAPNLVASR